MSYTPQTKENYRELYRTLFWAHPWLNVMDLCSKNQLSSSNKPQFNSRFNKEAWLIECQINQHFITGFWKKFLRRQLCIPCVPFDGFKTSVSSKNDVRLKTISLTLLSMQPSQLRTFPSSQKHVTIPGCVGWMQVNPGCQMILSIRQVQPSSDCQGHRVLPHWPLQFQGQGSKAVGTAERSLPNHSSLEVFKEDLGGNRAGPSEESTAGAGGGMLRKLSILVRSETGISDTFRRKRTWLSVALGHINAHMQSECLRIKPSIKQGIIRGLWGWQTFTLGHRGLDLLSVTGEWMMGVGVTKEVTRGAPTLWSVFKSIKPTQVQADGWIGQYKKTTKRLQPNSLNKVMWAGAGGSY